MIPKLRSAGLERSFLIMYTGKVPFRIPPNYFVFILLFLGCSKDNPPVDLRTPEGAILSLEEAYRQKDIVKAIACKDFQVEATYMMRDKPELNSAELRSLIARRLELGYRAEMSRGFPIFLGVKSTFPAKREIAGGIVVVTELCQFPDGQTSRRNILVAKTSAGWKVMFPEK